MPEFLFHSAPPACAPHPIRDLRTGAPAVSRSAAALSRLLGRGLRLAGPDPALEWQVLPAQDGDGGAASSGDWLALDAAAGPVFLQDGARFLAGLGGIDGSACDGDWPDWMTGALAGRLAGTPLAGLRAVRPGARPDGGLPSLRWRLQQDGHAIEALAVAAPATWLALLAEAPAASLRMPWERWLPLALEWPLPLATHRLPRTLFDTLASGDVILPDRPRFDSAGHGRVTLGARHWRAVFAPPHHLHLTEEENDLHTDTDEEYAPAGLDRDAGDGRGMEQERGMEDSDGEGAASALARLGSVNVTLRFELGHTRLTLDQLRALGPRSILELQDGAPHAIAIVCGAQEVGRGEVVDVEGRLGVRISAWGPAC